MAGAVENKELLAKIAELGERAATGTGIEIADVNCAAATRACWVSISINLAA